MANTSRAWRSTCARVWGGGTPRAVRLFRFGNEPDGAYWQGSREEFCETYATFAKALKSVDANIMLVTPALMSPMSVTPGPNRPVRTVSSWLSAFLAYCQTNAVSVDFVSCHAYGPFPYYAFGKAFELVSAELAKYPGLSPIYGRPRLANDEWNILLGDDWSGGYEKVFDSAYTAAHNVVALVTMIDRGLELSIRYGGTFNDGAYPGHDFLLVTSLQNGSQQRKPAVHAFRAFVALQGSTRVKLAGGDSVNVGIVAGKADDGTVSIVIGAYDIEGCFSTYPSIAIPMAWVEYRDYLTEIGATRASVPSGYRLDVTGLGLKSASFERYLVDDSHGLELIESGTITAKGSIVISRALTPPRVELVKIRP